MWGGEGVPESGCGAAEGSGISTLFALIKNTSEELAVILATFTCTMMPRGEMVYSHTLQPLVTRNKDNAAAKAHTHS